MTNPTLKLLCALILACLLGCGASSHEKVYSSLRAEEIFGVDEDPQWFNAYRPRGYTVAFLPVRDERPDVEEEWVHWGKKRFEVDMESLLRESLAKPLWTGRIIKRAALKSGRNPFPQKSDADLLVYCKILKVRVDDPRDGGSTKKRDAHSLLAFRVLKRGEKSPLYDQVVWGHSELSGEKRYLIRSGVAERIIMASIKDALNGMMEALEEELRLKMEEEGPAH